MPRVSIITPTHDPRYLEEAYASLKAQTYSSWEWVVVPNNGAKVTQTYPGMRMAQCPFASGSVGAIKQFAFSQAAGEILVEFDHDDLLLPGCLEEVVKAFDTNPQAGFVYSNNLHFPDGLPYRKACGWEHRPVEWNGHTYNERVFFAPDPRSLSRIWYAPDHVRAWRRSTYLDCGGHCPDLRVCDDHDLLIRTYLATRMIHIDRCLYAYRVSKDRTSAQRNTLIQTETVRLYNRYAYQLAETWTRREGLALLDLGGRFSKPQGYVSLDRFDADIHCDLNDHIPFPDNSVGVVRAHDILEHLHDQRHIMAEIHRVLVDGGWLLAMVPSTDGRGAFQDPTHVSYWNQNSFWYWIRRQQARYIDNDSVGFQEFRLDTGYPSPWHEANRISYVTAYLSAIKSDARRPHENLFVESKL